MSKLSFGDNTDIDKELGFLKISFLESATNEPDPKKQKFIHKEINTKKKIIIHTMEGDNYSLDFDSFTSFNDIRIEMEKLGIGDLTYVHQRSLHYLFYLCDDKKNNITFSNFEKYWKKAKHINENWFLTLIKGDKVSVENFFKLQDNMEKFKNDNQFDEYLEENTCYALRTTLVIHNNNITKIPNSINNIQNLNTLIIYSCNNLKDIDSVGDLHSLKVLIIMMCNSLEKIPESIGQLHNLEELYIDKCEKLTTIPQSIYQLPRSPNSSLRKLIITRNPLITRTR